MYKRKLADVQARTQRVCYRFVLRGGEHLRFVNDQQQPLFGLVCRLQGGLDSGYCRFLLFSQIQLDRSLYYPAAACPCL
jgi:hypothetical protein